MRDRERKTKRVGWGKKCSTEVKERKKGKNRMLKKVRQKERKKVMDSGTYMERKRDRCKSWRDREVRQ